MKGAVAGVVELVAADSVAGEVGGPMIASVLGYALGVASEHLTFLQHRIATPVGLRDWSSSLRVQRTVNILASQPPVVVPRHLAPQTRVEHLAMLPQYSTT
jgi:hypothetical protein